MRTLTFILCGAMWLSPLSGQAQAVDRAALTQAEARVQELQQQQSSLEQRLRQLRDEQQRSQATLNTLSTSADSTLVRAENDRLRRKLATLNRQDRQLAQKQLDTRRNLHSEGLALLALYQHALARDNDAELRARRDALQVKLGMSTAPRSPAQIKQQVEQVDQAEAKLRRKARQVASKIRQLRQQQRLAGDVARTMRDQALFDEEERRLELSRVVTRSAVSSKTSDAPAPADVNGRSGGTGECSGGECGTPPSNESPGSGSNGGLADDTDGNWNGAFDPAAGAYSGDAAASTGIASQERGSNALLSDLVAGSRVTTLLDEDVDTLLGRGGLRTGNTADGELHQLEALRIELLRSADHLARERNKLEAQARSPRP